MTPDQRALARHALGLPNDRRVSYRNRYFTPCVGEGFGQWSAMCREGLAVNHGAGNKMGSIFFSLTRKGAEAALEPRELLCREDFPPEPSASAIAEARS